MGPKEQILLQQAYIIRHAIIPSIPKQLIFASPIEDCNRLCDGG